MASTPDSEPSDPESPPSDGGLFGDLFGTPEMRAIYSDSGMLQAWLDAEAALARAEASLDVIPAWAAEVISACARAERLDRVAIREGIREADHPLMSTIRAFSEMCPDGAGEYVHWGATTQDIMDTGMTLQLRAGLEVISGRLQSLVAVVTGLTVRERGTPLAGRTHGQQALPITLGFKSAIWLSELQRHQARLREARPRMLVGQLSGAAGTLASLGEEGLAVQAAFCEELELGVPEIAWHVARDGLAELASVLAMLAATCSRIANEVIQLQKTEVAELEERQLDANVGSSTMPQKRNPMTAEGAVAAARLARRNVPAALEGMLGQHERDMATWQSEWAWVPDLMLTTDATLALTEDVIADVRVDRDRMAANLRLSGGLIMAEAVMLELARTVGRQTAHDVIHRIAMQSVEDEIPFLDALAADDTVRDALGDEAAISELLDPRGYLGSIDQMIERVLDRATPGERSGGQG